MWYGCTNFTAMAKDRRTTAPEPFNLEKVLIEVAGFSSTAKILIRRIMRAIETVTGYKPEVLCVFSEEPQLVRAQQVYIVVVREYLAHALPDDFCVHLFVPSGENSFNADSKRVAELMRQHKELVSVFPGNIPLAERGPYVAQRALLEKVSAEVKRRS